MNATRRKVLRALDDGPTTGPDLADRLSISRAAVWKHVDALRDAGFEIEGGDDGYALRSVPEFGGAAVAFELDAPYEVEYHDSLGSTNDRARELAEAGDSATAVVAEEQTAGRGRLDREWTSPRGGVWLSILDRPDVPPSHAPIFTMAAAVAVADAAREAGVDAAIKWPNDVEVDGKKLAGVLTEMRGEADRLSWIVVGIGVNANVDPADVPGDRAVTSLREEVGDVNRRLFTQRVLERFAASVDDSEAVLPDWRELASTLGREVRVETPGGVLTGTAVDVAFPGGLVLDTPEGRRRVSAGDCEHLRPAE